MILNYGKSVLRMLKSCKLEKCSYYHISGNAFLASYTGYNILNVSLIIIKTTEAKVSRLGLFDIFRGFSKETHKIYQKMFAPTKFSNVLMLNHGSFQSSWINYSQFSVCRSYNMNDHIACTYLLTDARAPGLLNHPFHSSRS